MVRWLNIAMSFAMVFAIIAVFAVRLRCALGVSIRCCVCWADGGVDGRFAFLTTHDFRFTT